MNKQTEALKLALDALEIEDMACRYEKEPIPEHIAKAITALREALAEQPVQQEPYCWMSPEGTIYQASDEDVLKGSIPMYLGKPPAQRKPLTDEQIWDEVKAADLDWQTGWSLDEDASNRYITFARAIEAAHGIKENT